MSLKRDRSWRLADYFWGSVGFGDLEGRGGMIEMKWVFVGLNWREREEWSNGAADHSTTATSTAS